MSIIREIIILIIHVKITTAGDTGFASNTGCQSVNNVKTFTQHSYFYVLLTLTKAQGSFHNQPTQMIAAEFKCQNMLVPIATLVKIQSHIFPCLTFIGSSSSCEDLLSARLTCICIYQSHVFLRRTQ